MSRVRGRGRSTLSREPDDDAGLDPGTPGIMT